MLEIAKMFIYSNGKVEICGIWGRRKDQAVSSSSFFLNDSQGLNNILPKSQIMLVTNKEIV